MNSIHRTEKNPSEQLTTRLKQKQSQKYLVGHVNRIEKKPKNQTVSTFESCEQAKNQTQIGGAIRNRCSRHIEYANIYRQSFTFSSRTQTTRPLKY